MNEVQNNILLKARHLFYRHGIRNVSMDDVAKHISVSKKTIYACFDDKSAFVTAIMEDFIAVNKSILFACNKQSSNAIEEVMMQVEKSFPKLARINYTFFFEVEKYFPTAWKLLVNYRKEIVLQLIIANLKRGFEEGLFRNNLPLQFTADIRLHHINTALNPHDFNGERRSIGKYFSF